MLDIHSHILPGIDDGSQSVEQSIEMLNMLGEQGVTEVVFTPHFYAEEDTPEAFLERRDEAYELLMKAPEIKELGMNFRRSAEVCYYIGVSGLDDPQRFCIEGTPLFMLEMPRCKWDTSIINEVKNLASRGTVIVLLAHIDRFIDFNKISVFEDFVKSGVLMQVNADFLADKRNKRTIKKIIKKDLIHFIGTDCHNTTTRRPNLRDALDNMYECVGEKAFGALNYYEEEFFN